MRLCAVAVCLWVSAAAQAQGVSAMLGAVEKRYNSVRTLEVAFTEEYAAPGRMRKMESGTLLLRKPGRMRWNYTSPKGKLFLSDGTFFYLYLPETQRVHKARTRSSGDMHAPLAFLLGRLDFQKDFQRFISRPDGVETWIVAEPRSRNLPYTQVEFAVTREMRIRRVRVTGQDRSTLDFTFEAEKVNPPLDAKLFEFQLPAGATLEEALE